MRLFTSPRERAFWLSALVAVLVIYSTLGAARVAAESLRERNLLRIGVAALLLAVAVALAVGLVRRHPGRREVAVAFGFAVVYAVALLRLERAEERLHLLQYGLVAILIYLALEERRRNGGGTLGPPWLMAILLTSVLGWIDEGIQAVLPSRVYDLGDVALNAMGAVLAIGAAVLMAQARRRDRSTS